MIKKNFRLAAAVLTAALLLSPAAQAQTSRLYFASYIGLLTYKDMSFDESSAPINGDLTMDNGYSFAAALGLRLSNNLRVETELSYNRTDLDRIDYGPPNGDFKLGGEYTSWQGLVNLYYDIDLGWKVVPFLGAGLGFTWHDVEVNNDSGFSPNASDDALAFAWQVGGGMKYRVRPDLAFTGAYRYVDGTDIDINSYEIDYGTHEFRVGFEYDLP